MASTNRFSELMRRATSRMRESQTPSDTPTDDADDFVTGFSNFRTQRDSRPGHTSAASAYRRRTNPLYSFKVVCLEGPEQQRAHPILIRRLNAKGLGSKKIVIGRRDSLALLRTKIRETFPRLANARFRFFKANYRNKLTAVTAHSLKELKAAIRYTLYVRPESQLVDNNENTVSVDTSDEELIDPQISHEGSTENRPESSNGQINDQAELPSLRPSRSRQQRRTAAQAEDFIHAVTFSGSNRRNTELEGIEGPSSNGSPYRNRGIQNRNRGTPNRNRGTPNRNTGTPNQNRGTPNRNTSIPNRNRGTPTRNRGAQNRSNGTNSVRRSTRRDSESHQQSSSDLQENTEVPITEYRAAGTPTVLIRSSSSSVQSSTASSSSVLSSTASSSSVLSSTASSSSVLSSTASSSSVLSSTTPSSSVQSTTTQTSVPHALTPSLQVSSSISTSSVLQESTSIPRSSSSLVPQASTSSVSQSSLSSVTQASSSSLPLASTSSSILFQASNQPLPSSNRHIFDVASILSEENTSSVENTLEDFIPEIGPVGDVGPNSSPEGLKDALIRHRTDFINNDLDDPLLMEVRRHHILTDALAILRVSQEDLHNPLRITFCGEDGVDLGGLRREFWSLFLHKLAHSSYVKGKPGRLTFQQNFMEKKKRTFFHLGQLAALSILQDGPGMPLFSDAVTDYILNGAILILNPDDLPNSLTEILKKMKECTSSTDVQRLYSSMLDESMEAGFLVPVTKFSESHVIPLQAAFIESQVTHSKDELDQFIQGLETFQVLGFLRQEENRAKARNLFSGRIKPVTVAKLRSLLKFHYSEGISEMAEKATGQGFITFLQATKGQSTTINGIQIRPKDVLMWLSGSCNIPAIGFHKSIDVNFGNRTFVNTCALALTLMVQPDLSPEDAVLYYTETIINSQTFTHE